MDGIMGGFSHISGPAPVPRQPSGLAAAFMQALQQHPGGISAVMETLQRNGSGAQMSSWASGRETMATPQQVQQALEGTGLIEATATRAAVSRDVAAAAVAAALPALIRHLAPSDYVPQPGLHLRGGPLFSRMP